MKLEYGELLGHDHVMGKQDCFTLFRNFYKINYDIEIPKFAIPRDWSADDMDILGASYESVGFELVQDWTIKTLHPGDVLCIAIGTSKPNHFAIYLGDNQIIHHLITQLSEVAPLRDFWIKTTCYVIRHPLVEYVEEQKPTVDLMELVRERYRVKADTPSSEG